MEPNFSAALAWKACTMGQAWSREFRPRDPARWVEIDRLVRKAIELDDNDAECHRIMCRIALVQREYERANTI
jgi:adenylate cyclase